MSTPATLDPIQRSRTRLADRYAAKSVPDRALYERELEIRCALLTPEARVLEVGCRTSSTAPRRRLSLGATRLAKSEAHVVNDSSAPSLPAFRGGREPSRNEEENRMRTESGLNESDARARTIPRIAEGRSRRRRLGTARAVRTRRTALLLLLAASGGGCATGNYDFETPSRASADLRAMHMSEALAQEHELGEGEALYDLSVIPLARTRLNVFAESQDEDVPDGFVEADIDAHLPLFGFVDMTVRRYDTERRMYERHDYDSYLWGLFQTYREQVDTEHGLRERKHRRFLWLFGWSSSPSYVELTE